MRRRHEEGSYIVVGPGEKEKRVLNLGIGISVAQTWATKRRREEGTYTYQVRDLFGTTTYATVTKEEDGTILTRPSVAAR